MNKMKSIICDSSSLISLAETCNINVISFLKTFADVQFVIPPSVYSEIITCPIRIPQFEFGAVRLRKLLDDEVISVFSPPTLAVDTKQLLSLANNVFRLDGQPLQIVHAGEAECLAAYSSAQASALAIDEKTTRLLVEDPYKLAEAMQSEYKGKLLVDKQALDQFNLRCKKITVLRSSELLATAALKGFFSDFKDFEDEAFHSSLYALRRAGCSLPTTELEEYGKLKLG